MSPPKRQGTMRDVLQYGKQAASNDVSSRIIYQRRVLLFRLSAKADMRPRGEMVPELGRSALMRFGHHRQC